MKGDRPCVQAGGRYATKQAAEALGVSRRTIQRWTANGLLRRRTTVEGAGVYTGSDIIDFWERKYKLLRL